MSRRKKWFVVFCVVYLTVGVGVLGWLIHYGRWVNRAEAAMPLKTTTCYVGEHLSDMAFMALEITGPMIHFCETADFIRQSRRAEESFVIDVTNQGGWFPEEAHSFGAYAFYHGRVYATNFVLEAPAAHYAFRKLKILNGQKVQVIWRPQMTNINVLLVLLLGIVLCFGTFLVGFFPMLSWARSNKQPQP